jgi:uncharacterized repeat protein (TIGR03803 family)
MKPSSQRLFGVGRVLGLFMIVAYVTTAPCQTFSDLYNFGQNPGDPCCPQYVAVVAQGRDGNLYSTSPGGGANGSGTVFKITPTGTLSVLYNFDGAHGAQAYGGLTLGTDGWFYGVTIGGGVYGKGTVFKIAPSGKLTVLHDFTGGDDGSFAYAPPIQGRDGKFYGTTQFGGTLGDGTVYRITPSGKFTTVHNFDGVHGSEPVAPLVQSNDGINLYGTTYSGGKTCGSCGIEFAIAITNSEFDDLHDFDSGKGWGPDAGLTEIDRKFYGTTISGGKFQDGTVYVTTPDGMLTVLHHFDGNDGWNPFAGLVQATDGNLYGATNAGGTGGQGTLFHVSRGGAFSVLYNFDGSTGASPQGTLVQHTNGLLYGDTVAGGTYGHGTLYSLSIGSGPFVSLLPTLGKIGETVGILSQGLTGTTNVSFNGVSAIYTVVSDTYLTAKVPTGSTTGVVTVATPGGMLKSNRKFVVLR